jgi:hypothetical protein
VITADTITEEMIHEVRSTLPEEPAYGGFEWQRARECEIASGPPGLAWLFHPVRRMEARARIAAIINANMPRCDAHDLETDTPCGNSCSAAATHRLEWEDGRFSLGCDAHLEIDPTASVKLTRIVKLESKS